MDKLIDNIIAKKSVAAVGLDTSFEYLPAELQDGITSMQGASFAITTFNKRIIDAIADIVPAVKIQVAYYEMYGVSGMQAFYDTIMYAKAQGLVVISDCKRNDISSTADCYASAHLGTTTIANNSYEAFPGDMLTINGYLGADGIEPFVRTIKNQDKGIFVLVKTSNKSSSELQNLILKDGRTIYQCMGDLVNDWGTSTIGKYGYSKVGAVVGATHKIEAEDLRARLPHTFFLIPGYGAQGGLSTDLVVAFDKRGLGGIVNASRSVICAYKQDQYKGYNFTKAAREATIAMNEDIQSAMRTRGIYTIGE